MIDPPKLPCPVCGADLIPRDSYEEIGLSGRFHIAGGNEESWLCECMAVCVPRVVDGRLCAVEWDDAEPVEVAE